MNLLNLLEEIGLTEGEAKVYLALLKLGSSPVNKIQEETKLHRTNIYDFAKKLTEKGLLSYSIQKGVRQYSAVDPEKLHWYLQEKQDMVKEFLPRFHKLQQQKSTDICVEVYNGVEGIKFVLNDIIREGKNYVAFGIDDAEWEKRFSIIMKQHFRKEKERRIIARCITSENVSVRYAHGRYRFLADEFFHPTPIMVYGDKVCTIVWNPLTVILTQNSQVAKSHKKHFNALWKIAKSRAKNRVNKL